MSSRLIRTVADLDALDLEAIPPRPEPRRVLMCTPEHFDVVDVKNAFMEGNVGTVDRERARREWEALRDAFEARGYEVVTIRGAAGLEDMVFAANQALPGIGADGRPYALLGRMRHPSRRREVPYYREWFEREGYRVLELPEEAGTFEGQGDAIWHPGRQLLWGGHGQRTSAGAYELISEMLGIPVVLLELAHPAFYHLDTCFCALAPDAAMIFPGAFAEEGRALISRLFARVIEVGEREAGGSFACNGLALDGRVVFLQRGATETVARLRDAGFETVEVETGEFLKSGGSVYCLKAMVY